MSATPPDPFAALPGVDVAAGRARTLNNDKLYRRLLVALGAALKNFAARFGEAFAAGDAETASRLVHDLASNSGSLGVLGVERAARALEAACHDASPAGTVESLLAAVEAEIAVVLPGLERLAG